jgi:GTPase SAR1 family protein
MSLHINEIKNKKLSIKPIKMKNDEIIKDIVPPLPNNYGFFIGIIGRPNSGKSTLWLNLINSKKSAYWKRFDKIFIFSASLKTIGQKIKLPEDRMKQGLDFVELENVISEIEKTEDKVLFIFDDVVTSLKKNVNIFLKLVYNRRHIGGSCSIMLISQIYNKIPLEIRKVFQAIVLFKTNNQQEIHSVYEDISLLPKDQFEALLRYCFDDSHSFIFIDVTNNLFYHNYNKLELSFDV